MHREDVNKAQPVLVSPSHLSRAVLMWTARFFMPILNRGRHLKWADKPTRFRRKAHKLMTFGTSAKQAIDGGIPSLNDVFPAFQATSITGVTITYHQSAIEMVLTLHDHETCFTFSPRRRVVSAPIGSKARGRARKSRALFVTSVKWQ